MRNQQVAARFLAQGCRPAKGSRMFYDPDTRWVYSYGYHFPVAAVHRGAHGEVVLLAATTPSSSTSRHRQLVIKAAQEYGHPYFCVPNHLLCTFIRMEQHGYRSTPDGEHPHGHHGINVSWLLNSAGAHVGRIGMMRGDYIERAQWLLQAACEQVARARRYAEAFGVLHLVEQAPQVEPTQVLRWGKPTELTGIARRNYAAVAELLAA